MVKESKYSRKFFGTDGIRGVANQHPMTAEVALHLGMALTSFLKEKFKKPRIVIGKDTRRSGYMLETAITSGVTSMGGHAYLLGPLPTPSVAYHIRGMRAQGGVMISASHNPYQDNGLKVFQEDGYKPSDEVEAEIEKLMQDEVSLMKRRAKPEELGRAERIDDAMGRYLVNLKTIFRQDFELTGLKIVFDGANGAAYDCGLRLFQELGAKVIPHACDPDGFNINENCAQADSKILGRLVQENGADVGIGVDGDADRLLVVDETGQLICGEHIMYELAVFLKEIGRLESDSIVTTSMANKALETALTEKEIKCHRSLVGDRYVTEMLKEKSAIFGGETSGHYIFLDQNTTADGLFSALEVLSLLQSKCWKASRLRQAFELFPQRLVSLPVKEKRPIEKIPHLLGAIKKVEDGYKGQGRVNVRYSGTQSMIRLMVEGPDLKQVDRDLGSLVKILEKELC